MLRRRFRSLGELSYMIRLIVIAAIALLLGAGGVSHAAAPDLTAENIKIKPKTAYLGTTSFTLSLTIRNIGTATAAANTTRIWASADSQINGAGNDVLIYTLAVPALGAGKSVTYTSTTTPALWVDPNRVGPSGTDALPVGTYFIGVQVDVYNNAIGELSENNIFNSADRLTVGALQPSAPTSYLPGQAGRIISVIRPLEWTTATQAARYDVSLARIKDLDQKFYKHAMLDDMGSISKVYVTALHGSPYNVYSTRAYSDYNIPDLLAVKNGKLDMYYNIADYRDYPHFFPAKTLIEFTTSTMGYGQGSVQYTQGSISSVCVANLNSIQWKDKYGTGWSDGRNDIVVANYKERASSGSLGKVTLLLNLNTTETYGGIPSDPIERWKWMKFLPIELPNARPRPGGGYYETPVYPYGIKSVAVADFDDDSDNDIIAGADRIYYGSGTARDKVVVYQSSQRNNDPDKYDTYTDEDGHDTSLPMFRPVDLGIIDQIDDVQDMAVGDFDRDMLPDVALVSFLGNKVYVLHNTTSKDGDDRSTRSIKFTISSPLFADDSMTSTVFRGASTITTCDFYGNRVPDIIGGAYFDGKVVVWENKATSVAMTFIPHVLTTNMPNVERVLVADMNCDGVMDIVAGSPSLDKICWYENLGNYQFKEHVVVTDANRGLSLEVGDLNADLLPDILNVNYYDNRLTWYANYPVLTLQNQVATNLLDPHYQPTNRLDFNCTYIWKVTAKSGTQLSSSSPLLTFHTQPTRINVVPSLVNPMIEPTAGVAFNLDVLCDGPKSVLSFTIDTYLDPHLERAFQIANMFDAEWPMKRLGSFIYNLDYNPGQGATLLANFDATTVPEGLYNTYVGANGSTWTDYDGVRDGVRDGVGDGHDTCGYVDLFGNELEAISDRNHTYGDDVYQTTSPLAIIYAPSRPQKPSPADGLRNVATQTRFSWSKCQYATVYDFLMAKASAAAPTYTSVTLSKTITQPRSMVIGNLDNDSAGLPDVLVSYVKNGKGVIGWFSNLSSSGHSFLYSDILGGQTGAPLVAMADMNGDKRKDILAVTPADSQIKWFKNNGGNPLTFGTSTPIIVTSDAVGVYNVQGVDLNGDGVMDVLAAMTNSSKRLCWFQRPGGSYTYTPHVIDAANGVPVQAIAADVDGDGDMDVIAAFWSPNSVAWYENKGGSPVTFVRHVLSTTIDQPQWLATGDMESDGDLDIICSSPKEGRIYQFVNNGAVTPSFATNVMAIDVTQAGPLAIGDFNHDSRLDVISSTITGNDLLFFSNNGGKPASFSRFTIYSFGTAVAALGTADMDSDHFTEVMGLSSGGVLSWFDFVLNFSFEAAPTKQRTVTTTGTTPTTALAPAMGYNWQVNAKRVIPVYGGKLERVTSSSLWTFFTGQSDLIASSLSFTPTAVSQAQVVQFKLTETNAGSTNSAGHYTEIWASPDSVITRGSSSDIRLARIYIDPIPAGGSITRTLDVSMMATGVNGNQYLLGTYYVGFFVDTDSYDNSESSKDNNKLTLTSPVLKVSPRNAAREWAVYP